MRDPLGRTMRADCVGEFAPLGIRLQVETNSADILEACRVSFGRCTAPRTAKRRPPFLIRLLVDPSFTEAPPWPDPVFRSQGDLFYVVLGRQNTAVTDLRRRISIGFLSPAMVQDPANLRRTFLECLALTMATHGSGATHTYVHASAVAMGDRGILFSGARESGKSTLAYACARQGFHVVADDVVYLDNKRNGLTAWGSPLRLRFLADCVELFPELKGRTTELAGQSQGEVEIEVEELLPGSTRFCCKPAALVFLNRCGGRTVCEPLEPDRAVELLSRDLIADLPEIMEKHRRAWRKLVHCGSYLLNYGTDLDSVIRLLTQLLNTAPAEQPVV